MSSILPLAMQIKTKAGSTSQASNLTLDEPELMNNSA